MGHVVKKSLGDIDMEDDQKTLEDELKAMEDDFQPWKMTSTLVDTGGDSEALI